MQTRVRPDANRPGRGNGRVDFGFRPGGGRDARGLARVSGRLLGLHDFGVAGSELTEPALTREAPREPGQRLATPFGGLALVGDAGLVHGTLPDYAALGLHWSTHTG